MIKIFSIRDTSITPAKILEKHKTNWLSMQSPTTTELDSVCNEFLISRDLLEDFTDRDEAAHFESEDHYKLFIVRIPVAHSHGEDMYRTTPLWMIFVGDSLLSICPERVDYLDRIISMVLEHNNKIQDDSYAIFLSVYLEILDQYQKYLRSIDELTKVREKDLYNSIKKNIFPKILQLEKSLVYFTTSLKSNERILSLFSRGNNGFSSLRDSDLLEDVLIEQKQAVEMTNIYTTILANLTSTFETVISQNLNRVMKRLTFISMALMLPTFIASVFGMNVPMPLANNPHGIYYIISGSAGVTGIMFLIMKLKKML